jgi:hypothetical protein
LAAIWGLLLAAILAFDTFPRTLRSEISGFAVLGIAVFVIPLFFLARGLFAFTAYRAYQQHDRAPTDPLALAPYEEGSRIRKHPKFLNKKSAAAYAFLILSPLPYLWFWTSQKFGDIHLYNDEAELLGAQVAGVAIGLGLAVWGARIYRRARRAAMLPGSALTRKDTRPIVLYLRSFHDDTKIKLRARATNGRILPERLLKIPFEEVVTDHLWGYGPVLAIGDPRTKSKPLPLGAARDYVDDSTWEQKVIELMRDAAMVVVVAGGTQGLAWEIDTIVEHGLLGKLVLLLPPVGVQELQARLQALTSHTNSNVLPTEIDFVRSRAVIFPKGRAALIAANASNDWTYEAVLDEAALMIQRERDAVISTSQSAHRLSRAGRVGLIVRAVASDGASMMGAALIAVLFVVALGGQQYYESVARPYASAGYQRDEFVEEIVKRCRDINPRIAAERLANYCTCIGNDSADVLTLEDLQKDLQNDGAVRAKLKSVAGACFKKTLGR